MEMLDYDHLIVFLVVANSYFSLASSEDFF
jgi:hypothetical protein